MNSTLVAPCHIACSENNVQASKGCRQPQALNLRKSHAASSPAARPPAQPGYGARRPWGSMISRAAASWPGRIRCPPGAARQGARARAVACTLQRLLSCGGPWSRASGCPRSWMQQPPAQPPAPPQRPPVEHHHTVSNGCKAFVCLSGRLVDHPRMSLFCRGNRMLLWSIGRSGHHHGRVSVRECMRCVG